MGQVEGLTQAELMGMELDALYDELSSFVCDVGPELLTRGMPAHEANKAILACLKKLKQERDDARLQHL